MATGLPGPDSKTHLEVNAPEVGEKMVDVVLCPVGPGCAPPHDCARYWAYTSQWNLLDYPCLIFPTGLQCGVEDEADAGYTPRNAQDEYNRNLCESLLVSI